MATRFLLHSTGATVETPAFDAGWEQTGQAIRRYMDVKPRCNLITTLTNSANITVPITTTQQILCYQFISRQVFCPRRLTGTVSMVIRTDESATTANVFLAYVLRAMSVDGARSLGTLASSMTNAGTEFSTASQTRIFNSIALTATSIRESYRIVLDLGGHAQAPTAAKTYFLRAGNSAASEFALTSGLTTDLNPWLEVSADLETSQSMPNQQYSESLF